MFALGSRVGFYSTWDDNLEPSPFSLFIMILMALTIVTRPSVKSKSVASCSGYEIARVDFGLFFSVGRWFSGSVTQGCYSALSEDA